MKAKIKGEWLAYNYAINSPHQNVDKIIALVNKSTGKNLEYIGKSKVICINDEIIHLAKRHLFFKVKLC